AQCIGPPDQAVVGIRVEPALQSVKSREVEEHRSDELNATAPPVDAPRLPGENAQLPVSKRRARVRVDRLQPLEEPGRGEEDRADEEAHPGAARADELFKSRKRAEEEARRSDREQDAYPPGRAPWRPPDARALRTRELGRVLAVGARRPRHWDAVRPPPDD